MLSVLHDPGVHPKECNEALLLVIHDFKRECAQFLLFACFPDHFLPSDRILPPGLDLLRTGQVVNHCIKKGLNALVLQGTPTEEGY